MFGVVLLKICWCLIYSTCSLFLHPLPAERAKKLLNTLVHLEMERTDEFLRATKIYANEGKSDEGEGSGAIAARELTQHSKTALRVSIYLADNEKLVRKMEIL